MEDLKTLTMLRPTVTMPQPPYPAVPMSSAHTSPQWLMHDPGEGGACVRYKREELTTTHTAVLQRFAALLRCCHASNDLRHVMSPGMRLDLILIWPQLQMYHDGWKRTCAALIPSEGSIWCVQFHLRFQSNYKYANWLENVSHHTKRGPLTSVQMCKSLNVYFILCINV